MTVHVSVTAEQYGTLEPVGLTGEYGTLELVGLTGENGVDLAEVLTHDSSSSSSQTVGMALTEVQTLVELDEVTV